MAKFRKTAALLAAVIAAGSVTGCGDTTYSLKSGDEEVKAGVYIGYLQNELSSQLNMLYNKGITEDPFSQTVDGKSLSEYVKDTALKSTKEFLALRKQFDAEGLKLTDEQLKSVNSSINETWNSNGELYEYMGISKDSMKELYKASLWSNGIFEAYYGEGGKEAPSADDLKKYIEDNYIRYKMIVLYKSSASDEETKKKENEEKLKERDEFLAKANGLSFADFDALIKEHDEYTEAKSAAAKETDDSSKADDSSKDDTSSAADTSSTTDVSSAADTSSVPAATPSAESKAEDASSSAESTSEADPSSAEASEASSESDDTSSDADAATTGDDTSSAADSSSEEASSTESTAEESSAAETVEDPYKNDIMINVSTYTEDELTNTESGKLFKFIKEMELGKAQGFENENGYYIVIKGDVSERSAEYASDRRSTVVHDMKDDEYQSKIDSWVSAADIKVNDKAVKRYTPEVIYDRMNEYYKKNKSTT